MAMKLTGRERRKRRIRKKIEGTTERPRMSVFRSLKHIGAQIIDDTSGATLVAVESWAMRAREPIPPPLEIPMILEPFLFQSKVALW